MDLSDKSFTSSLELSQNDGALSKFAAGTSGILVEEAKDPY